MSGVLPDQRQPVSDRRSRTGGPCEPDLWAEVHGVTLDLGRRGKPKDNAFVEPFNGRFRAECLNAHWFLTLADAAEKLEAWRRDYNEVRPHGAIGNKVPMALMKPGDATSPSP